MINQGMMNIQAFTDVAILADQGVLDERVLINDAVIFNDRIGTDPCALFNLASYANKGWSFDADGGVNGCSSGDPYIGFDHGSGCREKDLIVLERENLTRLEIYK